MKEPCLDVVKDYGSHSAGFLGVFRFHDEAALFAWGRALNECNPGLRVLGVFQGRASSQRLRNLRALGRQFVASRTLMVCWSSRVRHEDARARRFRNVRAAGARKKTQTLRQNNQTPTSNGCGARL